MRGEIQVQLLQQPEVQLQTSRLRQAKARSIDGRLEVTDEVWQEQCVV